MLPRLISASTERQEAALLAAAAGLASHQFYRKHEPSISLFFIVFFVLHALIVIRHTVRDPVTLGNMLHALPLAIEFDIIYLATLTASILLYRVLFHPLRRYQGPLIDRTSKWVWFYRVRSGRFYEYIEKAHRKYGDVIRLGPNDLVFFTPEDAALVNGPLSKLEKGDNSDGSPITKSRSVTFVRNRVEHRYRRRIWDQGFTGAALQSYEPRLTALLESVAEQFSANDGREINFADWASFFAFDAMGELGFGKDFEMVKSGRTHNYREFVHKTFRLRALWMIRPWCKYIVRYLPMDSDIKAQAYEFTRFSNERFDERKAQGTIRPDIFSHLLAQDVESGGRLTEDELREDAKAIILAGSDTTSYALTMVFYNLIENPGVYTKIQNEIDALYKGEPFKVASLNHDQIPYVSGAISETLRLFPPAPEPSQRTTGNSPTIINGKYVPAHTSVYLCPWVMHRDERNFSRPLEFIPERWTDSLRPKDFHHVSKAWVPFGLGLYNCAGRALAVLEMKHFMIRILYLFQIDKGPNYNREKFLGSLFSAATMDTGELPLLIKRRSPRQEMSN